MQLLSLVTKLAPLPRTKSRALLGGCLVFLLFYGTMMTALLIPFTKPRWLIFVYYFIMGVWPKGFCVNWVWLFLPLGSLLWLCGFPLQQKK